MAQGLFLRVFIRKKQNKSGTISFHIIQKRGRKQILVKSIGSATTQSEIEKMSILAQQQLEALLQQSRLDLKYNEDELFVQDLLKNIHHIEVSGVELILGKVFNEIGFNAIKEPLFKHLVLSRICYPGSKLKAVEYLLRHHQLFYDIDAVYRYLDKLNSKHKEQLQDISYYHTLSLFEGKIAILLLPEFFNNWQH